MIYGIKLRSAFTIGEIYRQIEHVVKLKTAVLNERPYLVERGQFSREQLKEIDGHEKPHSTGWIVWDEFLVNTFIKTAQGDFSGHFYVEGFKEPPAIKDKKWDLLFCNVDSSFVEIFSPSKEIIDALKRVFQFENVEYPGELGLNFDEG